MPISRRELLKTAGAAGLLGAVPGMSFAQGAAALEKKALTIAVGGQALIYYLPLSVAHLKGYFKEEGLDVTVADFVLAYTLDWANEVKLLDRCPQLIAYMERMYARPKAPKRIAQLRAALSGS